MDSRFAATRFASVQRAVRCERQHVRAHGPGAFVGLRTGTPYEQALLANYLLKQPKMTAKVAARRRRARRNRRRGDACRRAAAGTHVRLVMIFNGTDPNPRGIWLDDKGELVATDVAMVHHGAARRGSGAARAARDRSEVSQRAGRGAREEALRRRGPRARHQERRSVRQRDRARCGRTRTSSFATIASSRSVRRHRSQFPPARTVIDATGKTVMPGYVGNAHAPPARQSVAGKSRISSRRDSRPCATWRPTWTSRRRSATASGRDCSPRRAWCSPDSSKGRAHGRVRPT